MATAPRIRADQERGGLDTHGHLGGLRMRRIRQVSKQSFSATAGATLAMVRSANVAPRANVVISLSRKTRTKEQEK